VTEFLTGIVRRGAGLASRADARPRRDPVFPLRPLRSDARATAATAAEVREEAVEPPFARSAVAAGADANGARAAPPEGRVVSEAAPELHAATAPPPHEAASHAAVAVATGPAGRQPAMPRVEPPDIVTAAPDRLASTVEPVATPSQASFGDAVRPSPTGTEGIAVIGSDQSEPVTLAPVLPTAEATAHPRRERARPSPAEETGPRPLHASALVPRPLVVRPVAEQRAEGRRVVVPERPRVEVTIGHVDIRGAEPADVPAQADSFADAAAARRYLDRRWY
jgi:hypothetical protein